MLLLALTILGSWLRLTARRFN